MGRTRPEPVEFDVEAAIGRVLEAERRAREAIVEAEREAQAIEEAGRQRTQAIASRTERRMLRARAAFDDATRSAVSAIAQEVSASDREKPNTAERKALAGAVGVLAAKLTGQIV